MKTGVGLVQFTGVLLQTLPVMVLIGWLFEEEEFRRMKRDYYIEGSLMLILFAVIFAAVYYFKYIKSLGRVI